MPKPSLAIPITFAVLFAAGAIALFALRPQHEPSSGGPRVAVTIFPIYDIVRNIAGDRIEVALVMPPGAEPHSYEPTPSAVRSVAASAAVYAVGHGIDDWIDQVIESTEGTKVTVDRGINLRPAPGAAIALSAGNEEEEHADGDDPHYWLTVPNAIRIAETVAADLAERFPADADAFRINLAIYRGRLETLDLEVREMLGSLPPERRAIVTFHDAWYYFAQEYGLEIVGSFEPSPGREPTPRALAALSDLVAAHDLRALYAEPLFSSDAIAAFAADAGLTIASLDDIGGAPGRDSYEALIRHDAFNIAENQ